jgi:hypothetical protein
VNTHAHRLLAESLFASSVKHVHDVIPHPIAGVGTQTKDVSKKGDGS